MTHPLDHDAAKLLEAVRAANRKPFEAMSVAEARAAYMETRSTIQRPPPDVALVRDDAIDGPAGPIPLRVYRATGTDAAELLPGLVFLHGGGWVIGDLETHDVVCRMLANTARACVVAVDYRLAPEHAFPAAWDDALAAWDTISNQHAAFGIDPDRLAIGGDSAGGALAASVAIARRDSGSTPRLQLLFYPVTDLATESPGYARMTGGVPFTGSTMRWFRDRYLGGLAAQGDWRASPLQSSSFAGLPPTFLVTTGLDPLAEEGIAYARRLEEAGVAVTHLHLAGQLHGVLTMNAVLRDAAMLIDIAGHMLRRL